VTHAITRGGDGSDVLERTVNLPFIGGLGALRLVRHGQITPLRPRTISISLRSLLIASPRHALKTRRTA
jgi:hypothetical protein